MEVFHRGAGVAYPILVDPHIKTVVTESAEGWFFRSNGLVESLSSPPPSLSVVAPGEKEGGEWYLHVPPYLKSVGVEFLGMSGEIHAFSEGYAIYRLTACNSLHEPDGYEFEHDIVPTEDVQAPSSCATEPYIRVQAANEGPGTSGARISVGSIVISYKSAPEEEEIDFNRWGAEHEAAPEDKPCLASIPSIVRLGTRLRPKLIFR